MDRWPMMDRRRSDGVDGRVEPKSSATHDDPARWGPRLMRLLERSCALCRELDGLSESQGGAVRSGDTDALLAILSQRQSLIDELGHLNEEIEPFRRRWEAYVGRLPSAERATLEAMVAELSSLIERIGERDGADTAALEGQREALAAEISGVRRGRGAVAAYGRRPGEDGAVYQDRKG